MASRDLVVFENGTYKRRPSSSETIDFTSIRIGADNLAITEVDANSFGFGTKKLSNLSVATVGTDAPTWQQVQDHVAQQIVSGASVKQQLLTQQQLDDTLGILGGTVALISAQPTANDVFTLVNEDATSESWTFVASRTGANEVTIGATAADSMANLATAITTDSSNWKAYYDADALDSMYVDGLVGIYHYGALKDFYCYITQTGGTLAGSVADYSGEVQYMSDPSYIISIPTSDPGASTVYSGFKNAKANLVNGELHNVLAEDKIYSWDGDANSGAGEWYIMAEGIIPLATSGSGGGTTGKVTADEDEGLVIGAGGLLKAKVDDSSVEFDVGGNISVKDDGITAAMINADVAGDGLVPNGVTGALDVNVDDSSIETNADAIRVKSEGITATHIASSVAGDGLTGGAGTALSVNADDVGIEVVADALQLKDDGVTAAKINADVAGEGLVPNGTSGALDINVDGSTVEIATDVLQVKDAGITEAKLAASVAGDGLAGGAGTALSVNVDGVGIEIATDSLQLKDDGVTAAKLNPDVAGDGLVPNGTSGALDVNVDDSTIEVATDVVQVKDAGITEAKLAASVAGDGLAGGAGTALSVNVDDSTIEVATDTVQVKDAGITEAKLASSVAGDGLAGGAGTALSVNVGDGMQILSDAVAANYTKSLTNDNAGAITIRQVVYIKANGNVDLAQANVSALYDFKLGFVADASIASSGAGAIVVRRGAIVGGFSGLTPGAKYYVDRSTAGAITSSLTGFVAGEHVYAVGRAVSATEIAYDPDYIIEY